jgi:hypothetical protein
VPSSILFAGLVGVWLVVLVPMAARRRRPVRRTSDAAMSSRVLERPARAGRSAEEVSVSDTDGVQPQFRPGRGGYDPEAAELAARVRYTFRQRVVLGLFLLSACGAVIAAGLKVPQGWWLHGAADVVLVLYLINLRRQVRLEARIRARRAARMAGSRRAPRDDPHELEPLITVGRPRPPVPREVYVEPAEPEVAPEDRPALPRLRWVPFPAQPPGTVRLELDDEDPELHYLEAWDDHHGYRRAVGQ